MHDVDKSARIDLVQGVARRRLEPLRGASGKLYGMLDRERMIIEFKRGDVTERIDLMPYVRMATDRPPPP